MINLISELTNLIFEAKEKDSMIPIRELAFRGLLIPFDFLSSDAQFEYYWKNLDLFDSILSKNRRSFNFCGCDNLLKFHTPIGIVECNQPKIFSFGGDSQSKIDSDFPFSLYEEQIISYLISLLINPTQSLKEKFRIVDFVDRIIYFDKTKKDLDYALKDFQENQFLQLYFFDRIDELKKFYSKEKFNEQTSLLNSELDNSDYLIKNLLNPCIMPVILGIDRCDFNLIVVPKIKSGLIELFDYLNCFLCEYCNKNKTTKSILEYRFRVMLESQIHPELLWLIKGYYKGEHPLL